MKSVNNTEDRFCLAMKSSSDGLWDWNLETNEVFYSKEWKNMLGFKNNELENNFDTWSSLVIDEDRDRVLKEINNYINKKTTGFETEMRMKHKNGSLINILSRASLVIEQDGKALRVIGTHIDITERKRSEEFIKQTNQILEMIAIGVKASEIYDAIALMYEKRHPGMRCSLLELENGKLLHGGAPSMPKEYCDAVHGLEIGPNVGSCGNSTFTGKRTIVENIETDPNWADIKQFALPHGMRCCWSEPIINSKGKVLGAFGMYYDYPKTPNEEESQDLLSAARLTSIIMERDQSNKQMADNERYIAEQSKLVSMGEMIGNIAHQWRQPLSAITTLASGVRLDEEFGKNDSDKLLKSMDEIVNQANYLSRTIDDFRMFTSDTKSIEKLSCIDIINSSINLVFASFKNNNIKIIKNFSDDLIIDGIKNYLVQALINILNNSKDAILERNISEDSRFIFISATRIDDSFVIEVKDTALGIEDKFINRVFEPYFTTKHKSVGTGIGLSMSHQIITKKHKGYIQVSNEEFKYETTKYKGACFKIFLQK